MKKWLRRFLFAATLAVMLLNLKHPTQTEKPFDTTPQRQATHMVILFDGDKSISECTATAIGPHALLTAAHCNDVRHLTKIRMDLSRKYFHIQKTLSDDRDHEIYLIDGPAFQNFVPYVVRPARMGEHVYLYGNGHGQYPSRRLDGRRISWDDPSEVDGAAGIQHFTMPVIHGDSGSAIFADDGSIVAVTSYLWKDNNDEEDEEDVKPRTTVDFMPGFTADQIAEATSFNPNPNFVEPSRPEAPKKPNPFDFFLH